MAKALLTREFKEWAERLRDRQARIRINQRILRYEATGALGDWKSLGEGLCEMRIHHGPGYRLYFTMRGDELIILLCGSDKGDQTRAIRKARELMPK